METTLLKDVLIQQGQIDRYYEGQVPVHLWRALNLKKNAALFDFVEDAFVMSNGRPRPADIQIVTRSGVKWVAVAQRPRGISTFDAPGVPKGNDWTYYRIPAGTILPQGLAIVRDEHNQRFDATHYTIAPAFDMPLLQFKLLLNKLAASTIKEVG
jgi:Tse2 ADP-ribosyltransferase toxins